MKTLSDKLILGTVQMGMSYGINNTTGKIEQEAAFEILKYAYDGGVRFLDSAEAYGQAHEVIGNFHRQYSNCKFEIITKLPHGNGYNLSEKAETYLRQLNTNYISVLMFHSFASYISNLTLLQDLEAMKREGIVKKIGVSVYTNDEILQLLDNKLVDVIQCPFNLFDNKYQRGDVFQKAKEAGKIIHTRSCFLQGLFFSSIVAEKRPVILLKEPLKKIHDLSKRFGEPIQKIALHYCLQQNSIDNVLIGVDNLNQLKENLIYSNQAIPAELLSEIDELKIENSDLLNPSLWDKI